MFNIKNVAVSFAFEWCAKVEVDVVLGIEDLDLLKRRMKKIGGEGGALRLLGHAHGGDGVAMDFTDSQIGRMTNEYDEDLILKLIPIGYDAFDQVALIISYQSCTVQTASLNSQYDSNRYRIYFSVLSHHLVASTSAWFPIILSCSCSAHDHSNISVSNKLFVDNLSKKNTV